MKRWHLTLGLVSVALVAASVAPALFGQTPAATTTPPTPPTPLVTPPVAPTDGTLSLRVGVDAPPQLGVDNERFVVITIAGHGEVDEAAAPPTHLAVLIDTSGSMMAEQRLEHAKRAASHLVGQLRPEDTFSLVTFDDHARVVVRPGPVTDAYAVQRLIGGLRPGGGTNLYDGLVAATQQVQGAGRAGLPAQVLLLSDGQATSGITSGPRMLDLAANAAQQGVSVSAFGLGVDFNEDLLGGLADRGGGTYAYIRSPADVAPAFERERQRAGTLVARQTELTLRTSPGVTLVEVLDWTTTAHSDGIRVFLGDQSAGQTRKVVARVRVSPAAVGPLTLLQAELRYNDQRAERPAQAQANADTSAVATAEEVRLATNADAAGAAQQASGWAQVKQASLAWEAGERARAEQLAEQAHATLSSAAVAYDLPELQQQADSVQTIRGQYQVESPASAAGRHLLKMSKEESRVFTR